nr:ABC transporter ATP-binding protein [Bacteroidota bacterium]
MAETAIRIENLSKKYRLGVIGHGTLYRDLQSWWAKVRGKEDPNVHVSLGSSVRAQVNKKADNEFLALKDINIEIEKGELVGIIGANGAGKSTLLKILSRVAAPTKGIIKINGRVASLLEIGTGFHPELTGRENVYLNGAINGMTKDEITEKMDSIIDFAGIEMFLDTPVKRYSSGMYVRLAFAVAAHVDSDILLVDEVLAVGDIKFQKKCLSKMKDVSTKGRTVLFVSHNMGAIRSLCRRGIVLNKGLITIDSGVAQAIDRYLEVAIQHKAGERVWTNVSKAPGNDVVRLMGVRTINEFGEIVSQFDVRELIAIEIDYVVLKKGFQLCTAVEFLDSTMIGVGKPIFNSFDNYIQGEWGNQTSVKPGLYRSTCYVPEDLLQKGEIAINLMIFIPPKEVWQSAQVRELQVLSFSVSESIKGGGARGSYPHDWGDPVV